MQQVRFGLMPCRARRADYMPPSGDAMHGIRRDCVTSPPERADRIIDAMSFLTLALAPTYHAEPCVRHITLAAGKHITPPKVAYHACRRQAYEVAYHAAEGRHITLAAGKHITFGASQTSYGVL